MLTETLAPLSQTLLPELADELQATRRVLARVPEAQFSWQPHPKSMTLGVLVSHLTDLMGGIENTLHTTRMDVTQFEINTDELTTTQQLLARLDAHGAAAQAAIAAATPSDFEQLWSLCSGEQVLLCQTRADIIRHLISHMAHHRGQLSVYLRLLDVPVPPIYGPSADEPMFAG
jgi:uncharacterized damage-inducible protein DinB